MYIKGPYYFSQLVLTHVVIGQFKAPYSTVRPAKLFIDVFVAKMFRDLSQFLLDRLASKSLKFSCISEFVY